MYTLIYDFNTIFILKVKKVYLVFSVDEEFLKIIVTTYLLTLFFIVSYSGLECYNPTKLFFSEFNLNTIY